ncbi:ABC transporter permease subunit [Acetivibrio ethanolgignens]|nr:ABC transporter permease subunit [Acetivibrio ethanolgignens]
MSTENNTKKKSSFFLMFKKLFGVNKKELDIFEEEQMQSPFRTVVANFKANRLAMTAVTGFLLIFLFVLIGPLFMPINLAYQEGTQKNIAPGLDMMKLPSEMKKNPVSISNGASFGVGADANGKVYTWGKTRVSKKIDLKNIPSDMGKVVQVSAGYDHAVALNENGEVFAWGNGRLGQLDIPDDIGRHGKIVQIAAGYQITLAVAEDGYLYVWGNENINDIKVKKRTQDKDIVKVATSADTAVALTKSGAAKHLGAEKSAVSRIPDEALSGVVDIAATAATAAVVKEDGSVVVWGNTKQGLADVPEMDGKAVAIVGGRYHYTVLTDTGRAYSWGDNKMGQTKVPGSAQSGVAAIYGGYYQNYAVKADKVVTWGLKGYALGSDELGRDVLERIVNGGRMTMTVGAVAVIISTIIGIIVGGISGFFGGKVDLVLQRITEVFTAIPFLPFAMILSTIIGPKVPEGLRITIIMVILGVLSWPQLARLVRAQVLAEREKEFVTAARAMGVKKSNIVFKHIIPNVISVIIVTATLDFATCMLTEASLSFLGFGVQLPNPTWGNMLFGCVDSVVIQNYWWRWVFPAILLSICVICINTIGDGLRDAIDPKSNEK